MANHSTSDAPLPSGELEYVCDYCGLSEPPLNSMKCHNGDDVCIAALRAEVERLGNERDGWKCGEAQMRGLLGAAEHALAAKTEECEVLKRLAACPPVVTRELARAREGRDKAEAARAAATEECERLTHERNCATMDEEASEEISAELFTLCCAVLAGHPDAVAARDELRTHIEHVQSCRRGSCATELGETQKARADAATEGCERLKSELRLCDALIGDAGTMRVALREIVDSCGDILACQHLAIKALAADSARIVGPDQRARADAAIAERDTLRRIVEGAPHGNRCKAIWDGPRGVRQPDAPCSCWKAKALAKEGK